MRLRQKRCSLHTRFGGNRRLDYHQPALNYDVFPREAKKHLNDSEQREKGGVRVRSEGRGGYETRSATVVQRRDRKERRVDC